MCADQSHFDTTPPWPRLPQAQSFKESLPPHLGLCGPSGLIFLVCSPVRLRLALAPPALIALRVHVGSSEQTELTAQRSGRPRGVHRTELGEDALPIVCFFWWSPCCARSSAYWLRNLCCKVIWLKIYFCLFNYVDIHPLCSFLYIDFSIRFQV